MKRLLFQTIFVVLCALCGFAPAADTLPVIILPAGVYKLNGAPAGLVIKTPAEYRAANRWETIVTNVEGNAVNVYASAKLSGLQICSAHLFGVQSQSKGITLTLEDCWIHHCGGSGVMWGYSGGKLTMRRCLVEFCGTDMQHDHGIFPSNCEIDIQECIFRHNACFSAQWTPGTGTFSRNLVVSAGRALYGNGKVTCERNTVVGEIQGDQDCLTQFAAGNRQGNLASPWAYPWGRPFLCPWRQLYMPTRDLGGRGCYAYDPTHDLSWAAALWPPLGVMSSSERTPFTPAWPDN